jgi:hypothetical protein
MQIGNQIPQPRYNNSPRKLGCAFLLLPLGGIILALVSAWYLYTSWNFFSKGVEVQATVVRLESHSSSDSGTTYAPIFSYSVDGQTYEVKSGTSSNPPLHERGDVVTLLYDPAHPQKARENSFWEMWGLPLILCPSALFMLALSIFVPLLVRLIPSG